MAFIATSISLHSSYSKLEKDPDAYSACISAKGNQEYEINQGTFLVKLHLVGSQSQIITLCQDNHEVIVHGRLVEFERGLVMTIRANPAKIYSVPTRDFQHPSILAIAGIITKTSASSFSGGLTWFDISCADLLPSSRSSQSQTTNGILRNSGRLDARKSGSTPSGSTSAGSMKVTFDDILSPNHRKTWLDDSSRMVREESYGDDKISNTIRRVDTSNYDHFASSAPATADPPLATRSAAFSLPSPRSAPLIRPRANTDNAPLSDIQVDSGVKDCSSRGNRPIDRRFVPRPLFGSMDSVRLNPSNKVGGRSFQTFDKSPSTSTLPNRASDLFIPSKITRGAYSASEIARDGSFPSEPHDETARRSEDLLWADIDELQVNLSVGAEFDGRTIPANDFINPTLQAAKSRHPTYRYRRRGIYGAQALYNNEASIPEYIAHREPYDLFETGSNMGETALGNKKAQMKNSQRRRDAVFFGEKPEFERPKTASTSSRPSLTRTLTTGTTSPESTLLLTIRCFLLKGDHRFRYLDFPVGRPLAVTGELQGFVGEGPDRIASVIVSEIRSYSLGTDSAKTLSNCCGVSCTEQDPVTTERLLAALDPVKVESTRDLIGKAQVIDDCLNSNGRDMMAKSPLDGLPRRPALAKLRKASSNIAIKSKLTHLFMRSGSKAGIPTPPGSPERLGTSPRSAAFNEGSSLGHFRNGINATPAARLNPDEQLDYDLATPWSNNLTRSGLRRAKLRQELPRLRTAEAQALARQSLLPNLSQFSPSSIESSPPNVEGLSPIEAEFSPIKMLPQSDAPISPVETRPQPLTAGPQADRDLHSHPPAEKYAKSPCQTERRNMFTLKMATDQSSVFPQRSATRDDVAVGPAGYEASNPITLTQATCTTSWGMSPPIPHHHRQQHPKIPFPKFTPTWSISKKKRAKHIINALNSSLPSRLKYTASMPNLNFYPSPLSFPPPPKQQRVRKSPSAPRILPHREQRVFNNVAARNLAPFKKINEEDSHKEKGKGKGKETEKNMKMNHDRNRTSWYDSVSDSCYEEDEKEGGSTRSLYF